MKISDEIRQWCDICCNKECGEYFGLLADRIDREMVELPRDADGVPFHVGDTVWGCASDFKRVVTGMRLTDMWTLSTDGGYNEASETAYTHERPDSFERIAGELDAMGDDPKKCGEDALRDLAERIRKLAKEDE